MIDFKIAREMVSEVKITGKSGVVIEIEAFFNGKKLFASYNTRKQSFMGTSLENDQSELFGFTNEQNWKYLICQAIKFNALNN